jgi:hypothetical protein
MVINKKAQFFLLAAVIISAVVISLGITANTTRVNREPKNFYDFTYEVKREAGAVMDYEIYSGFEEGADLDNFVELLANDIQDRDKDANFLFVYGDNEDITVKNYASRDVIVDGEDVQGKWTPVVSTICLNQGSCINTEETLSNYQDGAGTYTLNQSDLSDVDQIDVEIDGNSFPFMISRHRQVVFIIKKDVEDESFVATG